MIWTSTTRSEGSPLRDERYVDKLSNQLCLTRRGFYDRLEEGGSANPNMGTQCRAHEPCNCHLFKIAALEQNLKNYFSNLAFALVLCQCCSRNDACEAAWQVSSSSRNSARVIYFKGHGLCGCQGQKGFKGSLGGSWLHGSNKSKILTSLKGYRAPGPKFQDVRCQRLKGIQILWLWCRCCVGVAGRRCSMIPKVQGSKVQESQGLIVFKGLNIPRFTTV